MASNTSIILYYVIDGLEECNSFIMKHCAVCYWQVFAGVYPMDQREHTALKAAIDRLCLNDGSVTVQTEAR